MNDRARVADELVPEPLPYGRREELRGLELLRDRQRLRFAAVPGLVVARKRKEHDQSEQDREAGGQHTEDARGPVTIGEEAAVRSTASNEQQRRDRDADGERDDQAGPDEAHRLAGLLVVLRDVVRLTGAIDRHAGAPRAISSREIDTATQRMITSGTHRGLVISSAPKRTRPLAPAHPPRGKRAPCEKKTERCLLADGSSSSNPCIVPRG